MPWMMVLGVTFLCPAALPAGEGVEDVARRVDERIATGWEEAKVKPATVASDAEFLRRAYLDLVGRVPTSREAREFLTSEEALKRKALSDELLESREFATYWSRRMGLRLLGRGRLPRPVDRRRFEAWLENGLATGRRYDELVRDVVTATGNPVDSPEVNFLLRFEMKPEDIAESVASNFLGIQLGCARCHDHPYERWTREDFYGMAAAFGQLDFERPTRSDRRTRRQMRRKRQERQRDQGATPRERRRMREGMMADFDAVRRTLRLTDSPRKRLEVEIEGRARTFTARFLDGTNARGNPREALADWMIDPENPYLSRAAVNRIWEAFFGRGLVEPVDAFGAGNPPSHPELLDELARDFTANGYDLRRLISVIVSTDAYQRSSRYRSELPAPELFAVARPRRMAPEQLFESLVTVTGVGEARRFQERKERFLRDFVFLFDTDAVDDVEIAQGTIPQSLFLLNGRLTNEALAFGGRRAVAPFEEEVVDELFLRSLSRFPTDAEKREVADFLKSARNRRQAIADVLWAIVNTSEFVLVH